jgi:hypothetical protein
MKTPILHSRAQGRASTGVASVLCVLLTTGAGFMACGGDDKGDKTSTSNPVGGDPTGAAGTLKLLFAPMYSAFEPTHKYQLPVIIDGFTGAKFEASDPSKVDVENTATGATLTMKAAGSVTITATLGNEKGSSLLTITETTAADWEKGNARYNSGVDGLPTDGGTVTVANFFTNRDPKGACTTCHSKTAKLFQIEHTPQQTGGFSDTEIITIFTTGAKPDNARQRTNLPEFLWGMGHRWTVEEADKRGLVTYLRSLAPATQGDFDYGIRRTDAGLVDRDGNPVRPPGRPRGDGGTPPRRDSGSATASDAGASDGGVTTPAVVDSAAPTEPADAGAAVQADAGV